MTIINKSRPWVQVFSGALSTTPSSGSNSNAFSTADWTVASVFLQYTNNHISAALTMNSLEGIPFPSTSSLTFFPTTIEDGSTLTTTGSAKETTVSPSNKKFQQPTATGTYFYNYKQSIAGSQAMVFQFFESGSFTSTSSGSLLAYVSLDK
jgi:hypothetical protein